MNINDAYTLDFTIPMGPTGRAVDKNLNAMILVKYNTTSNTGNLPVLSHITYPTTNDVFGMDNEFTRINLTGYYQFTITGLIKEENTNNGATLILRTRNTAQSNDLITIELQAGNRELYFSQTRIGRYKTLQRVAMILEKPGTSSARVENLQMMIQKIPFID